MSLGKDYPVIAEVLVVISVEFESFFVEEKNREDVGDGGRGSWMSRFADSDCLCGVDFDLVSDVFPVAVVNIWLDLFGSSFCIFWSASFRHGGIRYENFIEFIE